MKIENFKVYNKALIVVDMVNGFVKEGILHDESIARVIPRQIQLIKEYQRKGELVIFIQDTHTKESTEHKRFPDVHCVKGSGEEEIIDLLKPFSCLDNAICNSGDIVEIDSDNKKEYYIRAYGNFYKLTKSQIKHLEIEYSIKIR